MHYGGTKQVFVAVVSMLSLIPSDFALSAKMYGILQSFTERRHAFIDNTQLLQSCHS